MAEIKSTLDLVMERTKHLTMTAEEKAGQHREDFEKKLQGLLQQYADKTLVIDDLMEQVAELQADLGIDDPMLVASSVGQRIQPELDNAHWLALINQLAPAAAKPLEQALAEYREKFALLVRKSEQHHLESLAREDGIQGPAVMPNLNKDVLYREGLSTLENETRVRIDQALQQSN